MRPAWRQVVPALLIGCLIGAAAGSWCQRLTFRNFWKHGPDSQRLLSKFSRELSLDAGQKDAVKALLDAQHPKVMALHREMSAKMVSLRRETRESMRTLLNPDQQKKLDAMSARWEARHKKSP